MKYLIVCITIEGPFQRCGTSSHGEKRETDRFPSKSEIVGLIANACGWSRGDPRIGILCMNSKMAVREDRKGKRNRELQTCRDRDPSFGMGMQFVKNENGHYSTKMSTRDYIEDASYKVFLMVSEEDAELIINACNFPVRRMYLGSADCFYSEDLNPYICKSTNFHDAMREVPLAERHNKSGIFLCEVESDTLSGIKRADVITPDKKRKFIARFVVRENIRKDEIACYS